VIDLNAVSLLASGGVIGALIASLIAWTREYYKTEHQFRLDVRRNRIEAFSKLSTDYLLLALALAEFHKWTSKDSKDKVKFYFICKFFFYYSKIAEDAGGFEFENRQSEDVMTSLVGGIFNVFKDFDYDVFSDMIDLVTSPDGKIIRYNKFKTKIDTSLFSDFVSKIIKNKNNYSELIKYSNWLEQIMLFEINTGFRLWYNEKPTIEVEEPLKKYLIENQYERYIHRFVLSDKGRIKKFFYTKGNYF